jgi:uncharacterized protein YkwD
MLYPSRHPGIRQARRRLPGLLLVLLLAWSWGALPAEAAGTAWGVAAPAHVSTGPGVMSTLVPPRAPNAPSVAEADQVVYLTNLQRAAHGLLPLKSNPDLAAAAAGHSLDMAQNDFFSHTGSNGRTFDQRILAAGYTDGSPLAESIAAGYGSPDAVMAAWMVSPGHAANILNASLREIGVGYVFLANDTGSVNYHTYWTQDFGARSVVYPVVINLEQPSTVSSHVQLAIYGQGWAQQMRVSNRADLADAAWEPFAPSKAWTLLPGDGLRTVYVQLKDAAGHTAAATSDDIQVAMPAAMR